jgi:hypothetical protein
MPLSHLFKLLLGYVVAVLDRICAGINRGLYAGDVAGVDSNL